MKICQCNTCGCWSDKCTCSLTNRQWDLTNMKPIISNEDLQEEMEKISHCNYNNLLSYFEMVLDEIDASDNTEEIKEQLREYTINELKAM